MDFITVLRFSFLVTYIVFCAAEESQNDWLHRAVRSAKRNRRTHKNADTSSIVHAGADCCQNGGICIMGSFCHCLDGFYGRYCQHVVKHRSCGTLKHGTWVSAACNLCHCYDGQIICKPHDFPDCDKAPFTGNTEENPDYHGGIEFRNPLNDQPFDYDQFYDGYEEDYDTSASSATNPGLSLCLILLAVTAAKLMDLCS